jgi:hypothetical protein
MRVDASYATPRAFADASPIPMFLSGGASSNLAPSVSTSRADICYADTRVTDVACPLAPLRAAWLAVWCSSSSPGCSFSFLSAGDALARSVPASRPRQAMRRPRRLRRRQRCEHRTTSACSPRMVPTWISAHLQRTPALAPQKWYLIPSLRPALHRCRPPRQGALHTARAWRGANVLDPPARTATSLVSLGAEVVTRRAARDTASELPGMGFESLA